MSITSIILLLLRWLNCSCPKCGLTRQRRDVMKKQVSITGLLKLCGNWVLPEFIIAKTDQDCIPFAFFTKRRHLHQSGFPQIDKIDNNGNIGIRGFTTWKNSSDKMLDSTSSGNRTWASHSLWFQVQHYPFYTNLTFACKMETLGSLHSHALLILLKSSKSKHQVEHKQKFKDLLSSKCQVSVERIVLDLNQRLPGFHSHWG